MSHRVRTSYLKSFSIRFLISIALIIIVGLLIDFGWVVVRNSMSDSGGIGSPPSLEMSLSRALTFGGFFTSFYGVMAATYSPQVSSMSTPYLWRKTVSAEGYSTMNDYQTQQVTWIIISIIAAIIGFIGMLTTPTY